MLLQILDLSFFLTQWWHGVLTRNGLRTSVRNFSFQAGKFYCFFKSVLHVYPFWNSKIYMSLWSADVNGLISC